MLDMSQEKLGDKLGLTFQQIQKYEKGANRIGASRLFAIAQLLDVNVEFFFEGAPVSEELELRRAESQEANQCAGKSGRRVLDFISTAEALQLNAAFSRIQCSETRRRLVDLVKTLADDETELTSQSASA